MQIKCNLCHGEYILRYGPYGYFCGCSNYPKCKSQIPLDEFIKKYVDSNGINIYKWEEECEQCHKTTPVISYFLLYELPGLDESFMDTMDYISLGKIPTLDNYLLKKHNTLEGGKVVHNICTNCKRHKPINTENINYIVGQLWHREMNHHLLYNLSKKDLEIPQKEFKSIL